MPELPDLEVYLDALRRHALGQPLQRIRLASPFLLRSVDPPLTRVAGRFLQQVGRLGKRLVFALEGELYLVLHLMIAGRLRWREAGVKVPRKLGLAAFDFPVGSLLLTEAGSKKRASLYLVEGEAALAEHDPGGLEVLGADLPDFLHALQRRNHTLKRALTDPKILAGIGNAYSDEILHRARLSPFKRTVELSEDEAQRLFAASREVLAEWTSRLRAEVGAGFPEKVTAFRPGMAAHGRFGQPCPLCAAPIQRVVYAANEANYCPRCQTGGRILADRVLSRLLKGDWPRSLEELERQAPPRKER
jgi:formamidopyrimidine-DNA glycosylase